MSYQQEPNPTVPSWMLTFGDLMSLLLIFFIMLVAMSEIKTDDRSRAILRSLRAHFGNRTEAQITIPSRLQAKVAVLANRFGKYREEVLRGDRGERRSATATDLSPRIHLVRPGSVVSRGTSIFFEGDQWNARAIQSLQSQAALFLNSSHVIEVRAYVEPSPVVADLAVRQVGYPQGLEMSERIAEWSEDSDPEEENGREQESLVRSDEPNIEAAGPEATADSISKWHAAMHRAGMVAQFLMDDLGIPSERVRVSVQGDGPATGSVGSQENKRRAARIDLYLLDEVVGRGHGAE